jgi:glycosyltransferase involved in cell wall biosynthesis
VTRDRAPDITVIVPTRDGATSLPPLLDSLERQTLDRDRYEVVVVDNASRDDTAQVARSRGAVVVQEPLPSRAGARNAGVLAARADLIAYTDADCIADPGWLASLLESLGEHEMVAGPVRMTTGASPNAVERFESLWRFAQEQWVEEGWAATANLGVRRAVHEAIGGFDVAYRHIGEDADYCLRARAAGHRLAFCSTAVIEHDVEDRAWPMLKRAFFHGYSVNQINRRLDVGYRAWRHPELVLRGDRALGSLGVSRDSLDASEWKRMRRIAQSYYAMRLLGSGWAELSRAR